VGDHDEAGACHSNCVSQRCTKIDWPEGRSEGTPSDREHIASSGRRCCGARAAETFSTETIDALIKDAKATGTPLDGVVASGGGADDTDAAAPERDVRRAGRGLRTGRVHGVVLLPGDRDHTGRAAGGGRRRPGRVGEGQDLPGRRDAGDGVQLAPRPRICSPASTASTG
jgi:hypothetical protein